MQIDPDLVGYMLEGVKYLATGGLVYIGSRASGKKAAVNTIDNRLENFDQERNARIDRLEQDVAKGLGEKATLLQKIANLEVSLAQNQAELAECKRQLSETKMSLDSTRQQLADCGAELAASVRELKLLRRDMKRKKEQN